MFVTGGGREKGEVGGFTVFGEGGVVAVDEAGAGEAALLGREEDAVEGVGEARVARGYEEDEGGDEDGGIEEGVVFVALAEVLELCVVSFTMNQACQLSC
jgi:hypothetical protein